MTRTVTAWFEDEAAAARAREDLAELGIPRARIEIQQRGGKAPQATPDAPGAEPWLPSLLDALFLPAEELAAHREALRRGLVLLTAQVPDALAARAHALLDEAGTVDLDAKEGEWRASGWSPAAMAGAAGAGGGTGGAAMMPGTGGMDAEAARMLLNGSMASNTLGAAGPDGARAGERDPRLLARREPPLGRARSYVIEAPLAEAPRGANDAIGGVGGVA